MRADLKVAALLGALLLALGPPAQAVNVIWKAPNVTVYTSLAFNALEFENPLAGNEMVLSHKVLDWQDADYMPGTPTPYDNWSVNDPRSIDGNPNEVWLRRPGHSAWATTAIASTIISIHLVGDDNDGVADVLVDGAVVAQLDMGTPQPPQPTLVLVTGLSNSTHQVMVNDVAAGPMGDDVAILGAAALAESERKWSQLPDPGQPDNVFLGWNEWSVYGTEQIAADDWVCTTLDPVTDIHWWGSYQNWKSPVSPPQLPDAFDITIWTDVPQGPNDPFSHPGTCVWQYRASFSEVVSQFVGWDYDPRTQSYEACFKYELNLPQSAWFYQNSEPPDNIYWVSIAAVYLGGDIQYPWGWKTRPRKESQAPDDAVRIFDPTAPRPGSMWVNGAPIEWPEGVSWDLAFELTSRPVIHDMKWDQPPSPGAPDNVYYGWNEKSDWWYAPVAADDWVCTTSDPVTHIRWWGSFLGWTGQEPPYLPSHFHIQFWTDVLPGPDIPFSHPGQVIHEVYCYNYTWQFVGWDYDPRTGSYEACYQFDQDLLPNEYFHQDPGPGGQNIYWISIAACNNGEPMQYAWGWKTRPRDPASPAPDDAVVITQPVQPVLGSMFGNGYPLYWPTPEDSWDMAFELTSDYTVQEVKYEQPPEFMGPNEVNGWDEFSIYGSRPNTVPPYLGGIRADDWPCSDPRPITDIHWWGSYIGWMEPIPPFTAPDRFHIGIWTDDPSGVFGHPGTMIWQWTVPRQALNERFVGYDYHPEHGTDACFAYDFQIPDGMWFYQQGTNEVFWISISAMYVSPGQVEIPWGWKTRPHRFKDDAVRIWDPTAPVIGSVFLSGMPITDNAGVTWDLAFRLTTQRSVHVTKWSQPPQGYIPPNNYYGWNEPSVYYQPYPGQIVADDWICMDPRPVSDIHWWGSYTGWTGTVPPPDAPTAFHIGIWKDVPAGVVPFSHPGEMIHQWIVPRNALSEVFVGTDIYPGKPVDSCFFYSFQIPPGQWFYQQPGPVSTIYWLSISAIYDHDFYYTWGWKTRLRDPASPAPDDAVKIFDPLAPVVGSVFRQGMPIEDPPGTSWDMAFQLTSVTIGEPYVKWSQPPEPYTPPDAYNGWNEYSVHGGRQIVADDWLCVNSWPVTDIHWWGSFVGWGYSDPPRLPDAFHITIWTDVPPNGSGYSHPGTCIWETWCTNYTWQFVGWDFDPRPMAPGPEACFKFEQELLPDQWFRQEPGEHIYWVSIAAVYLDGEPQFPWGWKSRPRDPASPAPDDAVRIFEPTTPRVGSQFILGEPIFWPDEWHSWDMVFELTTIPIGSLTFQDLGSIPDHFWWPGAVRPNEMLCFTVTADPTEAAIWQTMQLVHGGSGNPVDVIVIDVWQDVDGNCRLTPPDVWLGWGTYLGGIANINLTFPPTIPAGSSIQALITYSMAGLPVSPPGSTFNFTVTGASGTGVSSGQPVGIFGLPMISATKIIAMRPIKIGEAKLLPVGTQVFLQGKVVTADFLTSHRLFYIEEEDRSSGIGVMPPSGSPPGPINIGDRVSLLGSTQLLYGTELIFVPTNMLFSPGAPIEPVGMNNRWTGGTTFGSQPGVFDNVWLGIPAYGLSNVGLFEKTWGVVTCYDPRPSFLPPGMPPSAVLWINDGSDLKDGNFCPSPISVPTVGVAVLMSPLWPAPPVGQYVGVTGIMRAIPSVSGPVGMPIRLLCPRSTGDIVYYSP